MILLAAGRCRQRSKWTRARLRDPRKSTTLGKHVMLLFLSVLLTIVIIVSVH